MKRIIIKTQQELDALPASFDEYTRILLVGFRGVVRLAWGNSSVEARENSSVVARENSSVVSWENSSVEAWGNSSVEAWGNSSVVARENSSVVARENSSVVARGNSSVEAWGNSSVVARENSSVVSWENSSVEAWGNSSVVAWGNSSVKIYSSYSTITGSHNSVLIPIGCKPTITSKGNSIIVPREVFEHDIESFTDIYRPTDGKVILFKSVTEKNRDFYTGKISYIPGEITECPDFDSNEKRQCGGGLHLSPTPQLALSYNKGMLLKCLVAVEDIVVFADDITKVRCRKVFVVEEIKQ